MFMQEQLKISAAEKGTLMHLCLQKIDFTEEYDINKLNALVESLVENRIITNVQAEAIDKDRILEFTKSNIAKRIKEAKEYYKEAPFYFKLSAQEAYGEDIEENVLIQGIIDLYFIDKDNKLVLVDYKTDYVQNENELTQKYKEQLALYKKALEKALDRNVDEIYIYSTYLGEEIEVII